MADIDMIPRSYRDGVRLRRQLRHYGAALLGAAVLGAGATALLHWRAHALEGELVVLRRATAQAQAAAARVQADNARLTSLQQSAAALAGLRGAGALTRVADAFDKTMPPDVWLRELYIVRDTQLLASAPVAPRADDLVVPPGAAGGAPQTWRVATTLRLRGRATDYSALGAFLRALGQQNGIGELRLGASSASLDFGAIDFDAGASLDYHAGAP